jgi:hypothetical protein
MIKAYLVKLLGELAPEQMRRILPYLMVNFLTYYLLFLYIQTHPEANSYNFITK